MIDVNRKTDIINYLVNEGRANINEKCEDDLAAKHYWYNSTHPWQSLHLALVNNLNGFLNYDKFFLFLKLYFVECFLLL